MTVQPSRLAASVLLLAGGLIVSVSALAIVLAKLLVDGGMTVRATDGALLDDLVPVLPFVILFAASGIAAGIGLLQERTWADRLANATAAVAVTVGSLGFLLVTVGRDPLASAATSTSTANSLAILGTFTILYLTVIAALAVVRTPRLAVSGAAA